MSRFLHSSVEGVGPTNPREGDDFWSCGGLAADRALRADICRDVIYSFQRTCLERRNWFSIEETADACALDRMADVIAPIPERYVDISTNVIERLRTSILRGEFSDSTLKSPVRSPKYSRILFL